MLNALSVNSAQIEGIEGNRKGDIGRNPATIARAKFHPHVIAGWIELEWVAVLAIGLIRKGAIDDS